MSEWDDLIQAAGQKYNVDPQLIAALVQVESSGNPKAYNASTGATGLGQQIPETAKALGIDPTNPAQSIEGAAKLLDENLRRYGNAEQAILAYHGGTDQANWGPKTKDYLRKITSQYGAPTVARATASADDFAAQDFAAPAAAAAPGVEDFAVMDFAPPAPSKVAASATVASSPQQNPDVPADGFQRTSAAAGPAAEQERSIPGMAWDALGQLGEVGLNNANAAGRGILDAFDAPAEWLASGAEASGLTGLLNRNGIAMPTYDQQVALNKASRDEYEARTTGGIQQGASRLAGNIAGVLVPVAGAESLITRGASAASNALGNPQVLGTLGNFLRGNGGLASRATYGAAQGAAGGALLSGGQPDASLGDSMALGAALGAVAPFAISGTRYLANSGKALVAPFSASGRNSIAGGAVRNEAEKDALNMAQIEVPPLPVQTGDSAADAAALAAQRLAAADALNRAAAGGRIASNFNEIIPGSQPTLAQATGNAGVAALERAAMSRQPNAFAERQLQNYAARNAYMSEIKGTPETLAAAVAARDAQALPHLRDALANARPANANPVVEEINSILAGRAGQRDDVVRALTRVKDKLELPNQNGVAQGLETRVEQLYGIRQSINDQLATVSGRDNSAAQLASRELIQVRDKLDEQIQKAAPGFKEFLGAYSTLSRPVDAQRYLQALDLTDQTSQRITLSKVKSALNRIEKQRSAPGANEAKSISDEQLAMLRNLQADLQREANSSRGMAIGSNTFQNFATNQLIDTMLPGKLGAVAPVTPGAAGGALGYALGGNIGAGIGAIGGQQAAGIASRAMNAQGPEIEARLIDYLLNPRGAEVLRQASRDPSAANLLLRRAAPVAPSGTTTGGQSNR